MRLANGSLYDLWTRGSLCWIRASVFFKRQLRRVLIKEEYKGEKVKQFFCGTSGVVDATWLWFHSHFFVIFFSTDVISSVARRAKGENKDGKSILNHKICPFLSKNKKMKFRHKIAINYWVIDTKTIASE